MQYMENCYDNIIRICINFGYFPTGEVPDILVN